MSSLTEMSALRETEKRDPATAAKKYADILGRVSGFNQPISYYQDKLKSALKSLKNSNQAVLSEDVIAAFPYYFDQRLATLVNSHMGMARCYWAQEKADAAEGEAKQALAGLKRAQSPFFLAKHTLEAQRLLKSIYDKKGLPGKALMAKLNADLMDDYLHSKQSARDFFLEKQCLWDAKERVAEVDRFVDNVNEKRMANLNQRLNAFASALGQVSSGLQQAQINDAMSRSGGQVTPQIQMMQWNKLLTDINVKTLQGQGAQAGPSVDAALNPMSNLTVVGQLVNPDMGVNPQGLIKTFASAAAQLSGSESVKKAAQSVSSLVDAVVSVRQGNDMKKTEESVAKFAEAFTGFQAQVEGIQK
ncbi:MAG: hypothetical protein HY922_10860 [Elusimicrobia bacterium]|nr:hypothetical protein [Elusimicrobiota bacterium]